MSAIRTAIHRPVTVSMFVVAVILFGYVSLDRLALNLLPDISYPSLTVQTDYPDAAPEEVENLITRPIEEAVGVVGGLTRVSSVSRPGQSEVVLEFSWDTDMNLAALDAREKLDFVSLPRDSEKPTILRFDPSYDPILRLRLYSDESLSKLRRLAEREVKKALEATDGVAAVKVIGGVEEQIHVEIDEKRLAELGIPITEVSQALGQENLNQAAGSLYDLDASYLVRMLNQFRSVEEIEKIVIRNQNGRRTVLGDIARVWRGARERTILARLDGKDSVELSVYKEGDANTVTVANAVQLRLDWLKEREILPETVHSQVVFNQADFISQAVENVRDAAVVGGLLATLILFIFLRDLRSTLTVGFSIPISIMATFTLMYQTGITLNLMSLGGIALGVGMLVDNSIVVLESVHRHRKTAGSLREAVFKGTSEVGMAVTASTLTTVAVFLPLVFVEGIAGQLFRDQALTITFSLLASLVVALTVIPMILALRFFGGSAAQPGNESKPTQPAPELAESAPLGLLARGRALIGTGLRFVFVDLVQVLVTDARRGLEGLGRLAFRLVRPFLDIFEYGFKAISTVYPRLLGWSLDNKPLVITLALAIAIGAGGLALRLGSELIPPLTQGEFSFEVRMPEGTPLEQTNAVLVEIEDFARALEPVSVVFSSVGGSTKNQFATNAREENFGQLYVVISDKQDRETEAAVVDQIRSKLGEFPEVDFTFSRPTLFSFKTPVEVEVYAFDLDLLRKTADQVAERLGRVSGLSDVQTSTELGNPELVVRFDREKIARWGLDETEITNVLRNKIRGDVATRYREEDRQIDILVRAEEGDRQSIEDIRNLVINRGANPGPGGGSDNQNLRAVPNLVPIRLGAVAVVSIGRGPSEIRRIRSQRAAVVSANLTGRALSVVSDEINRELVDLRPDLPANVSVALAGQNEELTTSFQSLAFALGLAVFLVYLVMASQFESLVHPFIIMFTVPLGLSGVAIALWVTGTNISVMVLLGVIVLAGIVVNNAIVLIDYANRLRRQGHTKRNALLEAGTVRLRPIVMTTLTTVLGLLPMVLGGNEGAEVRAPMAVAVIGGLLFSTLLTLVLIPVVYELVDRKRFEADEAEPVRSTESTGSLSDGLSAVHGD